MREQNEACSVVLDIGKTVSKITLFSSAGAILKRMVRTNEAVSKSGLQRLDVAGIQSWLTASLGSFAKYPIRSVIPAAHGAGICALIDDSLAFAPLDYEQPIPAEVVSAYRSERDSFAVTGSPALPEGLNIGTQLFWLERLFPEEMAQAVLLPWAQYWAWFLSGVAVSEVTSLGCHSDLWAPDKNRFSPMAERLGWARRFAPIAQAGETIGPILPELAQATGLAAEVEVLAGLHDSNAALLAARGFAEIANEEATILSTGTWFVAMRSERARSAMAPLDEYRDCLVNVDAYGARVPSARFMGGREIEIAIGCDNKRIDIAADQTALVAALEELATSGSMLLPTLISGCGPFPEAAGAWVNEPTDENMRRAAIALYAALVADTSLDLIGAQDRLLVEGRFARSEVFTRALATLRRESQVFAADTDNDVSFGALRLIDSTLVPSTALMRVAPLDLDLDAYRTRWLRLAEREGLEKAL